ncbi:MAG: gluconate 2-dehydrogenase subunit 3 family protein, partial [Caulobacteraceae bacterium]
SPSWNEPTRRVIDERLALDPDRHGFFDDAAWATLRAVCERIVPQPPDRAKPVPIAAMVDKKMAKGALDGFRDARMPPQGEAWRRALAAFEADAQALHRCAFHAASTAQQDALLKAAQEGYASNPAWGDMPPKLFFANRLLPDILSAYYAHPTAWNEIGFGGPASPRGYVRMDYDRRDPWEAAEAYPGREGEALRENRRVG